MEWIARTQTHRARPHMYESDLHIAYLKVRARNFR